MAQSVFNESSYISSDKAFSVALTDTDSKHTWFLPIAHKQTVHKWLDELAASCRDDEIHADPCDDASVGSSDSSDAETDHDSATSASVRSVSSATTDTTTTNLSKCNRLWSFMSWFSPQSVC